MKTVRGRKLKSRATILYHKVNDFIVRILVCFKSYGSNLERHNKILIEAFMFLQLEVLFRLHLVIENNLI